MRNAFLVLVLAVLVAVMVPVGGWAQEEATQTPAVPTPAPVCSLDWERLGQTTRGWVLMDKPVFGQSANGTVYQVQVVGEPGFENPRLALIIAEYGDPSSKELGGVVYCRCVGSDGKTTLEEVGENPFKSSKFGTSAQKIRI